MDYSIIKAYAEGRLAGTRYARAKQENGGGPRPAAPFHGSAYLAGVEWERGFVVGFQLQERALATSEA
jgi:hypothetical protein